MSAVLSVQQLHKAYGGTIAVNGVSLEVNEGEVVGLLGPNGSGKTTIISMLLSVVAPTSGTIRINGADVKTQRCKALMQTSFAAVYAPLPGNLTVMQNLRVFALLYDVKNTAERIELLLRQFDLERFRDTKCGVLSSGEQMRICLAKAMLNSPRLLLLDEPTASIDPSKAQDIREEIRDLVRRTNCAVLWTSHNMAEVESLCTRVIFLSRGAILLEGDPRTLPGQHGKKTLEELFIALARPDEGHAS